MLRLHFKTMQRNFDKKYRYSKRMYHKNEYNKLETNAKDNPAAPPNLWSEAGITVSSSLASVSRQSNANNKIL